MPWKTERQKRGCKVEVIILFVGIALGMLILGAALLFDVRDAKPKAAPEPVEQIRT